MLTTTAFAESTTWEIEAPKSGQICLEAKSIEGYAQIEIGIQGFKSQANFTDHFELQEDFSLNCILFSQRKAGKVKISMSSTDVIETRGKPFLMPTRRSGVFAAFYNK